MTTTPNPTWYDVLGVPRDASSAEVKAAWRSSTDKFEPGSGSGQFRMFNEAADVLLDPDRRAAYDASLDAPLGASPPPATTTDDPPLRSGRPRGDGAGGGVQAREGEAAPGEEARAPLLPGPRPRAARWP